MPAYLNPLPRVPVSSAYILGLCLSMPLPTAVPQGLQHRDIHRCVSLARPRSISLTLPPSCSVNPPGLTQSPPGHSRRASLFATSVWLSHSFRSSLSLSLPGDISVWPSLSAWPSLWLVLSLFLSGPLSLCLAPSLSGPPLSGSLSLSVYLMTFFSVWLSHSA